ncbi:MAG TPA: hypothetical protein VNZ64_21820 [Candidatus Acidoferrum sp.]|nr:hypothetical protein [Candidatus Acidoferrum sp.]
MTRVLQVAVMCLAMGAAVAKADADVSTNGLELIPEGHSLWSESMLWDKDIVVRAGLGYKDNVALSPSTAQGSGFFASGLDLTIFRVPLDGPEVNFSITGDDQRYWRAPDGIKGEDLWLASARVQKYIGGEWQGGTEVRYVYVDQVLAELLLNGGIHPVQAKGNMLGVRPYIRRDFDTNLWLQFEAPITREWWQEPLDSDWKYGLQMILGSHYAQHSEFAITFGEFYIPQDHWLARDRDGNELAGKTLAVWRQVFELKWEHEWDLKRRWASTTRAGFNSDSDNGGGYFNYDRYYLSQELRFRTKDWEIKGSAGVSYYDFPVQTIGAPSGPTFNLTTVDFTVRAERRLYKSLKLFASFDHEQALSNDPSSEYKANVIMGGGSWEF